MLPSVVVPLLLLTVSRTATAAVTPVIDDDYNQWKQALNAGTATAAAAITAAPGFTVELLRSARTGVGESVPRGQPARSTRCVTAYPVGSTATT